MNTIGLPAGRDRMEWHAMMYLLCAKYPLRLLVVGIYVGVVVSDGLGSIGESDHA